MIRCIHQIMPPKVKTPSWMFTDGWGDCQNCIPDIANQNCRGFTPVALKSKVITIQDEPYIGGHKIVFNAETGKWQYEDTGEEIENNYRSCVRCGRDNINGDDACLGHLPSVKFACCGHGVNDGYIWFENGVHISGQFRIDRF